MTDKQFIDTAIRLSKLYEEANKDLFPVKNNAYTLDS